MSKNGGFPRIILSILLGLVLVASPRSFIFSVAGSAPRTPEAPAVQRQLGQGGKPLGSEAISSLPSTFSCGVMILAALSAAGIKGESKVARKAEPSGILGGLGALKKEDEEQKEVSKGGEVQSGRADDREKLAEYMDKDFDETDLEELAKKFAEEEASDTSARQVRYELYPSKQYVLYLAKKNAIRTWTPDGPDGRNRGCLEVQIAVATERIRNMVLHMREFRRDYKCRLKLTSLVCARRRMLDKLAARNLDAYMKIREDLKIRHVYRIEALKNRLGAYLYPIKDRPQAPGRKTLNRLKKAKQLMSRRLANQLRQGREHKIIHRTQKKLNFRRWQAQAYDEVAALEKRKELGKTVDPLNLP